ncbi:hypothetical protein, partial [Aeromonas dhakensis]|uniref:hypothetical protein n=1 Tax=Aeromonas dhakensis TaxID=196024 RepID=UPI003BA3CA24
VKLDDNPMKVLRECYVVSIAYLSIAGGQGGADHQCKSCHLSHWGSLLVKPERSLEVADDTFSETG